MFHEHVNGQVQAQSMSIADFANAVMASHWRVAQHVQPNLQNERPPQRFTDETVHQLGVGKRLQESMNWSGDMMSIQDLTIKQVLALLNEVDPIVSSALTPFLGSRLVKHLFQMTYYVKRRVTIDGREQEVIMKRHGGHLGSQTMFLVRIIKTSSVSRTALIIPQRRPGTQPAPRVVHCEVAQSWLYPPRDF